MPYKTLESALIDLEKQGELIRISQPIDPNLEMAALHLRVHQLKGPALLFENVMGSKFRAASNIFGTLERSSYLFKNQLKAVQHAIELKLNTSAALKKPFSLAANVPAFLKSIPYKNPIKKPILFEEISIDELPQIKHWKHDSGAFVTLPQVYSEDVLKPGIGKSNLGMYRIQLSGNDYAPNKEIGLHYQLHRGIGVHQTHANRLNKPLKVSVFVGGPPAHTVAAVMPLPEGISELNFAGLLAGRRFRYFYDSDSYFISSDADFVITGYVLPYENKPEGPFGDHLGYYSLAHPFPVMHVEKVYAKKNGIWPFTVVGRPPQEDTSFGTLIHHLTGNAIPLDMPGVKAVHAVDAAGVHPLLLAIGNERYTPYLQEQQPAEILTQANRILGTGQLSLAKYLLIVDDPENISNVQQPQHFFEYLLERINLKNDIHFYTQTSIDTLDYSGNDLNKGSKVVWAAAGSKKRELAQQLPPSLQQQFTVQLVHKGIVAIQVAAYKSKEFGLAEVEYIRKQLASLGKEVLQSIPLFVLVDDAAFTAQNFNNFLWVAFTRTNPATDIHGVHEQIVDKHWSCDALILDARIKPHHAPILELDPSTEKKVDRLFETNAQLAALLK